MTEQLNKTRYTYEVKRGQRVKTEMRLGAVIRDAGLALIVLVGLISSTYTVDEGTRGIVTRFSEAVEQQDPGLNFKVPFIDTVYAVEVRERLTVEELASSTSNKLPFTATVSLNWIINPDSAMSIFKEYRTIAQFETRVLNPQLRQVAKDVLSQYDAGELLTNRAAAAAAMQDALITAMEGYPVQVNSAQIENVALPIAYLQSIEDKEKAREDALREQYNLERQALEAQRDVQSAEASRDSAIAIADGQAYSVRVAAEAEADAIRLIKSAEADGIMQVTESLNQNRIFVDYTRTMQWDGALPTTQVTSGDAPALLMQVD